jgi:DHA2 family multidrug resistance protein
MATGGFILFFVFCWLLSNSTLESGTGDFFWPLIIRGIGMAILFVPLTTLAVQGLQGKQIGQGTGLNNMMRQLGGSFGVAILTTLIHLKSAAVRNVLIGNINQYNPAYIQQRDAQVHMAQSQGHSVTEAMQMSNGIMEGNVIKQTMLVTYDNMYMIIGVFVLAAIPVIYLQKFKKKPVIVTDAH